MSRGSLIALTGVETRRLLLHPLLFVGLVLSVVAIIANEDGNGQAQSFLLMGTVVLPLALGTFAAVNLAALSSTRAGAEELLDTLPQDARVRTGAQLLAVVSVVPIALAVLALAYLLFDAGSGLVIDISGARREPALVELAQGPVALLALGAVGVLLGRLAPVALLGAVVVVVVVVAEVPLAAWTPDSALRWAVPFANDIVAVPDTWRPCEPESEQYCGAVERFDTAGMAWHLLGLAVVGLGAALAALRISRPSRR